MCFGCRYNFFSFCLDGYGFVRYRYRCNNGFRFIVVFFCNGNRRNIERRVSFGRERFAFRCNVRWRGRFVLGRFFLLRLRLFCFFVNRFRRNFPFRFRSGEGNFFFLRFRVFRIVLGFFSFDGDADHCDHYNENKRDERGKNNGNREIVF